MKFKKLKKAKNWCKRRISILIVIGILIFPFIIDLLYHTYAKNFLIASEGELLRYYGTVFGICVPVFQYFREKKKEDKSRKNELKPIIAVDLEWDDDNNYTLTLTKLSNNIIKDVFLYWEPLTSALSGKQTFKLGFDSKYITDKVLDFSDTEGNDLIDYEDGYPNCIVLSCYDADNQLWQCEYNKITHSEKTTYFLKNSYLI